MVLDLNKLIHANDFLIDIPPMGNLRVGGISLQVVSALVSRFPTLDVGNDEDFVRFFIIQTAYRSVSDSEEYGRSISEAEAAGISLAHLDLFSEEYLRKQKSIFADVRLAGDRAQFPRGDIDPIGNGKIVVVREAGEDVKHYFRRTVLAHIEGYRESSRKLREAMMPKSLLTPSVQALLAENTALGKSLNEALRAADGMIGNSARDALKSMELDGARMRSAMDALKAPVSPFEDLVDKLNVNSGSPDHQIEVPPLRELYIPENPIFKTNEEVRAVSNDLKALTSVVTISTKFLENMNNLSIEMAGASAANAERAHRYNRVAIAIAAIGLIFTATFSGLDYFRSKDGEVIQVELMKDVAKKISESNNAVIDIHKNVADQLGASQRANAATNESISRKLQEMDDFQRKRAGVKAGSEKPIGR